MSQRKSRTARFLRDVYMVLLVLLKCFHISAQVLVLPLFGCQRVVRLVAGSAQHEH